MQFFTKCNVFKWIPYLFEEISYENKQNSSHDVRFGERGNSCLGSEGGVLLRTMIPPVAEPPGTVDRVMMTSCEIVPLITDTLTATLPASSRTV